MEPPQSSNDIEKISLGILKASKSFGVFPTPIDKIIKYSDLVVTGGIDIKSIEKKYSSFNISEAFKTGIAKIRGFLDRSEKIIYVDTEQNENRQSFVKLHEAGHDVLTWQKATLQFIDDDKSISPETKEEFEIEANYFASITLFQHDIFLEEIEKYELGIAAVKHLSKHFGASFHATIRRYVEHSPKRCALLIIENRAPKGLPKMLCHRNSFHSKKFTKEFGKLNWPESLENTWPFIADYNNKRRYIIDGTVSMPTKNGMKQLQYHFFNNTFNAFVLFFPKGENKKTKTTLILK